MIKNLIIDLKLIAHGDRSDNADSLWLGKLPSFYGIPNRGKRMLAVIDGSGLSAGRIVKNKREAIDFFIEELRGYEGWKKKYLVRVK